MQCRVAQRIVAALLIALISGCAGLSFADPDEDAAAKVFATTPGESGIYVYRNQDIGVNTNIPVKINDRTVGVTGTRTYVFVVLPPGKHTITAMAENTHQIELETAAGQNYYVWLEASLGAVVNRAHLHPVSDAEGQAGVRESRRVR